MLPGASTLVLLCAVIGSVVQATQPKSPGSGFGSACTWPASAHLPIAPATATVPTGVMSAAVASATGSWPNAAASCAAVPLARLVIFLELSPTAAAGAGTWSSVPVMLAAVPVVFWLSSGTSAASRVSQTGTALRTPFPSWRRNFLVAETLPGNRAGAGVASSYSRSPRVVSGRLAAPGEPQADCSPLPVAIGTRPAETAPVGTGR